MDDKIVKVIFKEGWETMYNTDLVQWSYGHILQIEGLTLPDGEIEVHFSLTKNNGNATVHIGTVKDNVITVNIPDYLLAKENMYQETYDAWAWIYLTDEESGRTVRKITFTVETRAKPDDYIYTDEEIKLWSKLEKKLKEVQEKQDFVAEYGVTTYADIKQAYERGCDVRVKYTVGNITKLEAGTYDADGNLLQSWDELMDAWKTKFPQFNRDISSNSVVPPYCVSNVIPSEAETLIISDTVTSIGMYMFYSFGTGTKLRRIVVPESVSNIGVNAFSNHKNLEFVSIANSKISCYLYDKKNNWSTFVGISESCILYYSGSYTADQLVKPDSKVTIAPYEETPNEALGIVSSTYDLLGSLEVIDNDFVFYTMQDNQPLKIVCNADGWSSEEIEYVKNTDYASNDIYGVVKTNSKYGIQSDNGVLFVKRATDGEIDLRDQQWAPITPKNLDYAVMKALTDSKNHVWTDEEKTAALTSLGLPSGIGVITCNNGILSIKQYATNEARAYSLVERTANGAIFTGTPIADAHATTKKYVDDLVSSTKDSISLKDSATGQVYNIRINNGTLEMILVDEEV